MKLTCIIVDDEELAREGIKVLLEEHAHVEILRSCHDGLSAIKAIEQLQPDLVFLDIQMPGVNGFEVIASLPKPRPYIIFATAHDQYAIKAFEINAIDYLLKPFSDERFNQALEKASDALKKDQLEKSQAIDNLISHTSNSVKTTTKIVSGTDDQQTIVFKSDGQVYQVLLEDITHVEAFDYYIKVHVNKQFFLIRETMKQMSSRLPETQFIRIHKSYIVNIKKVSQFGKGEGDNFQVTLNSGELLRVSRSYKNAVQDALK
ncbi:MAG: LytTR family DNA-binding domain-containing protein [Bacteroidota bacterium]